jgi:hypothetical protein
MLPYFLDNRLTDISKVMSLMRRPPSNPRRFLLEGLGELKNRYLSGNRTCDLPACNIMPEPTTLPRTAIIIIIIIIIFYYYYYYYISKELLENALNKMTAMQ